MTGREARALLDQHFPQGGGLAIDLDDEEGFGGILDFIAERLAADAAGPAEALSGEVTPMTVTSGGRLPEWEKAVALTATAVALYGGDEARRAQMLGRLRERGTPRRAFIRAALTAICGYAPDIIEHTRAALTLVNKRGIAPATIGPLSSTTLTVHCADNAPASEAGALLSLTLEFDADMANVAITLTPPSGAVLLIDPQRFVSGEQRIVGWPDFAGRSITGTWGLTIGNGDLAGSVIVKPGAYLLVEGIGRDAHGRDGLGSRIFEWSAAIDESRVTPATYDREVVIGIAERFNPAHEDGGIALYQTDGDLSALCDDDNCIADLCVCD